MNNRQKHLINYLSSKGITMIIQTFPVLVIPEFKVTKTDRFYRINGKVISKNMAIEAMILSG